MKKSILGFTIMFAFSFAIFNLTLSINSTNKLNNFELSSLFTAVQANSESGGQTNCYAGGVAPTSHFPTCQSGCPYNYMNNPQKVGTCNF